MSNVFRKANMIYFLETKTFITTADIYAQQTAPFHFMLPATHEFHLADAIAYSEKRPLEIIARPAPEGLQLHLVYEKTPEGKSTEWTDLLYTGKYAIEWARRGNEEEKT